MSITSLSFVLFIFAVIILYFIVPKKFQWIILLIANGVFYWEVGIKAALCVIFTATSIFIAALLMDKVLKKQEGYFSANKETLSKDDKKIVKKNNQKKRKAIMLTALLLNIGILCICKYSHFAVDQVNSILSLLGKAEIDNSFNILIPLGISFYTFQTVGYLLDVYWEKIDPQTNYFKFLLFVSFFPQMTQGPISDYKSLSNELFTEHTLDYKNYSWGFQRMLWGFMKKMVIADFLSPCVKDVFLNYAQYSGLSVLIGAFMYSIQIYADFSGYMDIMCGFCEMLGIRLTENFERPYFSKSITEYWRRWHISLGEWFKNYIYYPIGMSDWSRNFAKKTRDRFGKHFANTMPATIALLVVWTSTGLWHGASWAYIVWGLVNGFFIIFSLWMNPIYDKWKKALNIKESSLVWKIFQVCRTFVLVTIIKVLPEVGTLSDGIGLWKHVLTNHTIPTSISSLLPYVDLSMGLSKFNFLICIFCIILFVISSFIQRKNSIRYYFNKLPLFIRLLSLVALTLVIVTVGVPATWGGDGFLYANF